MIIRDAILSFFECLRRPWIEIDWRNEGRVYMESGRNECIIWSNHIVSFKSLSYLLRRNNNSTLLGSGDGREVDKELKIM